MQKKIWIAEDTSFPVFIASCTLFSVTQGLNCRRDVFSSVPCSLNPRWYRPARAQGDCPHPTYTFSLGLSRSQGAQQSQHMESAPGLRVQLDLWCLRLNFLTWDFDTCHSDFCQKLTVFPGVSCCNFIFSMCTSGQTKPWQSWQCSVCLEPPWPAGRSLCS